MARTLDIVVTGGSRGLGRAVTELAATAGHRVVIVCRDPDAGARAAAETGARLVVGDLSDTGGVRGTVAALDGAVDRIDVLVHNAGVWPSRRVLNADGFEQAFFTNHLAPFQLNGLLEERLRRVVQVSAGLYVKGTVDPDRTPTGDDFGAMATYANTKLANVMMLPLWAERWRDAGRTIDAIHPGVLRTGLGDRPGPLGLLLRAVKTTWSPAASGARHIVDLLGADGSGRYFDEERPVPLAPIATDPAPARRLWDAAAEAVGVPRN